MTKSQVVIGINESEAVTPPMKESEEASKHHLELAKDQGKTMQAALEEMTQKVAQGGAEKAAGNFLVGYAFEDPEGMYHVNNGVLEWQAPTDENIHIEISVRDGGDGRFIPALDVQLTVLDENGDEVATHKQPFLWHPWLYHYGRNWKLPGDGKYSFYIRIAMPDFPRHDKENGNRFDKPVEVFFKDINIKVKKTE